MYPPMGVFSWIQTEPFIGCENSDLEDDEFVAATADLRRCIM